MGWSAKVYILMAIAKSSRVLRNWQKDLNSEKVIPRPSGMRSRSLSRYISYLTMPNFINYCITYDMNISKNCWTQNHYYNHSSANFWMYANTNLVCIYYQPLVQKRFLHINTFPSTADDNYTSAIQYESCTPLLAFWHLLE